MTITKRITNGSSILIEDTAKWTQDDREVIARRLLRATTL